ncbi:uncharacterized protein LOC128739383 [Sabethes cyaneus]|uniref:uncharacterized protein LOC128739383 n=1 Tax=Sabethes cyaneus TaxID=53552 RepID=UPI00237EAE8C|nr:uncharacterized protein LOC128739383 [Sabethes cyaneus]
MPITHSPQGSQGAKSPNDKDASDSESESFHGFDEGAKRPSTSAVDKRITVLSRQQSQAQAKIQRIAAMIEDSIVPLAQLNVYVKCVESAYQEYCSFHNQLTAVLSNEEMDEHDTDYAIFEETYHHVLIRLETLILEKRNYVEPAPPQVVIRQQPLKAPVPTFNGLYENWPKFKATFLDIMSQSNDSDAIKLYHLDKSLVGAAAGILDAKTVNENNYAHAWEILNERFENPRVIIDNHIKGLLTMKKMSTESHRELRQLLDSCTKHIENLRYFKHELTGISELMVVHLISASMDRNTRKQWEGTIAKGELPSYDGTITFLKKQCNVLENCEEVVKLPSSSKLVQKSAFSPRVTTNAATDSVSELCDFCKGAHKNFQCDIFRGMNLSQRVEKVRELGMCFNCLRKGHRIKDCTSERKCQKCRMRHHTQLHDDSVWRSSRYQKSNPSVTGKPQFDRSPVLASSAEINTSDAVATTCSIAKSNAKRTVMLLTAMVNIVDRRGKAHSCRALLDCGSQVNLISKRMVDLIGLKTFPTSVLIAGVNNKASKSDKKANVEILSTNNDFRTVLECIVTPSVTGLIPSSFIDTRNWCIPPEFQLADPYFNAPQAVDLLIGNSHFFALLKPGQHKLGANYPELRETRLGWVVTGEVYEPLVEADSVYSHKITVEDVHKAMQRFWEIEDVAEAPVLSSEEQECEEHFRATHKRDSSGRFIVQLPLKENVVHLSNCRDLALKRFYMLEHRLSHNSALREQYVKFIQEYESLGHCKQVDERKDLPAQRNCYLPHHAVIRPDSTTTKCRVVFDASAKPSSSSLSLNDVQMTLAKCIAKFL